ncbi:MAG: tetratricopeptide repeat protein [Alistipes sp.]
MRKLLYIFLLLAVTTATAQKYPERSEIRKGNRAFAKEQYDRSIERYKRAGTFVPGSFEAGYNMGNALYRASRYDQAEQTLQVVAADTLRAAKERAEAFFNLGNAQFQQKKYQEALESYKNSLRQNPTDQETKYNYAYTKRLIDKNKDDKNKDKDKDQQDKDQQQKQDQNKNDQDKDQQDKDQQQKPDQGDPNKEQQGDPQPQQKGITPEEQERMLEAIQAQEDKTQEKLKEKAVRVVKGSKNW